MGHGRRTLLALAESLLHLVHLSALQAADLHGHLLDGGADEGDGGKIISVTVALDHLRGHIRRLDAEFLAHIVLHEGGNVGEITNGTANLSDLHSASSLVEALDIALHLGVPEHPFEAERCDVGMDAVRTADAGGVFIFQSLAAEHRGEVLKVGTQDVVGLLEKITVGRVHNVGRCQAIMYPLALLAEALAYGACEGHDVVARLLLYLLDAGDAEGGFLPEKFNILCRNHTKLAPGFGGQNLYAKIGIEFILFCPDGPHLGS